VGVDGRRRLRTSGGLIMAVSSGCGRGKANMALGKMLTGGVNAASRQPLSARLCMAPTVALGRQHGRLDEVYAGCGGVARARVTSARAVCDGARRVPAQ